MSLLVDAFEVVKETVTVPDGSGVGTPYVRTVEAPAGKKAISGGHNGSLNVRQVWPDVSGDHWNFEILNQSGSDQDVELYVVCVG